MMPIESRRQVAAAGQVDRPRAGPQLGAAGALLARDENIWRERKQKLFKCQLDANLHFHLRRPLGLVAQNIRLAPANCQLPTANRQLQQPPPPREQLLTRFESLEASHGAANK